MHFYSKHLISTSASHDLWHCFARSRAQQCQTSCDTIVGVKRLIYIYIYTCMHTYPKHLIATSASHDLWHCCARSRAQQCQKSCDTIVGVKRLIYIYIYIYIYTHAYLFKASYSNKCVTRVVALLCAKSRATMPTIV